MMCAKSKTRPWDKSVFDFFFIFFIETHFGSEDDWTLLRTFSITISVNSSRTLFTVLLVNWPVSSEGYSPVCLDISRKFLAIPLTASRDSFSPPVLLSQLTKNSKSELLCLDGRDSMWCRFTWWLCRSIHILR